MGSTEVKQNMFSGSDDEFVALLLRLLLTSYFYQWKSEKKYAVHAVVANVNVRQPSKSRSGALPSGLFTGGWAWVATPSSHEAEKP